MPLGSRFYEKLQQNDLFAGLDRAALTAALEGEVEIVSFSRGDVLLSAETDRGALGLVLRGGAAVSKKEGGFVEEKLREGDLFGLETLFSGSEFLVGEAVALRDTRAAYISKNAVLKLMQTDSSFSLRIIRYLCGRIYQLDRRIVQSTGGTAESRLAGYLLGRFGDYKTFEMDCSMQQLAGSLDISRASLYRGFECLEQSGAIVRSGKSVRLADRDLLCKFLK